MAEITVKGFVHKGATKSGTKGDFSTFSLSEGQKQKDGTWKNVWYSAANFKSGSPPADGSKVEVKGYLNMNEKDGKTFLNINVTEVSVLAEPKAKDGTDGGEPWDGQ